MKGPIRTRPEFWVEGRERGLTAGRHTAAFTNRTPPSEPTGWEFFHRISCIAMEKLGNGVVKVCKGLGVRGGSGVSRRGAVGGVQEAGGVVEEVAAVGGEGGGA